MKDNLGTANPFLGQIANTSRDAEMRAYDRLSPKLRQHLAILPIKFSAIAARHREAREGTAATIDAINEVVSRVIGQYEWPSPSLSTSAATAALSKSSA